MRVRTIQNVVVNSLGTVISMVAGLLVMPFLIHQLGNSGYGLWTLIGTLTGYFGVLDLGVGSAVGRLIAGFLARGEFDRINAIISTALALLVGVALFVMLCTFGAIPVFFDLFSVPAGQGADVTHALIIVGFAYALQFPAGVFGGVIWGYERFDLQNLVDIPVTVLRVALTFIFIGPGSTLTQVAIIAVGLALAGAFVKVGIVICLVPTLRIEFKNVSRATIREIYGFGIWMALLGLTRSFVPQIGPTVVGHRLGPALVTTFMVARQLVTYTNIFAITATQVMAPRAAANHSTGSADLQLALFMRGGRFAYALALFFLGGFVALGSQFIDLWQHGSQPAAYVLLLVLIAGEVLPMSQWLTYSVIVGSSRHGALGWLAIFEVLLAATLALLGASLYGLLGVACAVAFSALLTRGILQWLWGCRIMKVSVAEYVRYVFVPTSAVAAVPIVLFAIACSYLRYVSWISLLLIGAAYALGYSMCLAPFLFGREGLSRLMHNAAAGLTRTGT
jgi:O-antigen/teichoic acid export membrane protein